MSYLKQLQDLLTTLRLHTVSSVRENQKSKLPIIIENTSTETFFIPRKKFHFNDKWYSYKYSIDDPQFTFGIIQAYNIPYRSFDLKRDKNTFICSMNDLIYQHYCEPFIIFVNNKFVNWNHIEVVFDCDDTYLILHGEEYNWLALSKSKISMMILPFNVEYMGNESDYHFDMMYNILQLYIQNSLTVSNNKINITLPGMDEMYEYRGMVYNVGAWLYAQLKYERLGILSQNRVNQLKKIDIIKYEYDSAGNKINTLTTKFNALDKDSYDTLYERLFQLSREEFIDNALFRFNDNGLMDYDNGNNIIAVIDDSLAVVHYKSYDKYIYHMEENANSILFRENFVVFKDGYFDSNAAVKLTLYNISRVDNLNEQEANVILIYPKNNRHIISHIDHFDPTYILTKIRKYITPDTDIKNGVDAYIYDDNLFDLFDVMLASIPKDNILKSIKEQLFDNGISTTVECEQSDIPAEYLDYNTFKNFIDDLDLLGYDRSNSINDLINKYNLSAIYKFIDVIFTEMKSVPEFVLDKFYLNTEDYYIKKYLYMCMKCLDYIFSDKLTYENNLDNALSAIMEYDPSLLNPLYKSNIHSEVLTGREANASMNYTLDYEGKRGLKITRNKYENHESYVIVFEDGELLKEYWNMGVYPNFFFIPMERDFDNNAQIELLYFNYIDNNEIEFNITDNMIIHMPERDDKWRSTTIFNQYIRPEDMKIFCRYPEDILLYSMIVKESEDIAFNISYRDDNNDLYLMKDVVDWALNETDETHKFIAVSSRKFIYQRLYVDQKAYRIVLDKRFRYCDNQKQYVLFINGRRINNESFLITIPKYTRPFWGIYLYLTKFVTPEDRIELFYLPEELNNSNTNEVTIKANGYIETDKTTIDVPYIPEMYLFFINGKKIPSKNMIPVDSHTIRLNKDTLTRKNLVINNIYNNIIPEVKDYLNNNQVSSYEKIINFVKETPTLGYDELDRLFNIFVKISDTELDKNKQNVARIAIINEIVRDFWVTSGYPYNELPFVYDYAMDDYIPINNDLAIIPALDANQYINIIRNDFRLLYFYHSPEEDWYEIGSVLEFLNFYWEYSDNLYAPLSLVGQSISYKPALLDNPQTTYIPLSVNDKQWTCDEVIDRDTTFTLTGNTGHTLIERDSTVGFVNGIFFGNIDEDQLKNFKLNTDYEWFDDLMASIPKEGDIPTSIEQEAENGIYTKEQHEEYNILISDLSYDTIERLVEDWELPENIDNSVLYIDDINFFALLENGRILKNIINTKYLLDPNFIAICNDGRILENSLMINPNTGLPYYNKRSDLKYMLWNLNSTIQPSPELVLDKYIIGNNNYFIYACPERLAFRGNDPLLEFILPDVHSSDIVERFSIEGEPEQSIYVDNKPIENDEFTTIDVNRMSMVYLGEFIYTNPSGYSEIYCAWRSNGYFTKYLEEYEFYIEVRYIDQTVNYDDRLGHIIIPLTAEKGEAKDSKVINIRPPYGAIDG